MLRVHVWHSMHVRNTDVNSSKTKKVTQQNEETFHIRFDSLVDSLSIIQLYRIQNPYVDFAPIQWLRRFFNRIQMYKIAKFFTDNLACGGFS